MRGVVAVVWESVERRERSKRANCIRVAEMITTTAPSPITQRRPSGTRGIPLLPILPLLPFLFLHVLLPSVHSISSSPPLHASIPFLLSSMFPSSPSPPHHIRVLYVGPCAQALSAPQEAPSFLMSRSAIHCLADDHPQVGNCQWFIHADDRDGGEWLGPAIVV
jgi:hypothetical protein